jgi:hypothetical protein
MSFYSKSKNEAGILPGVCAKCGGKKHEGKK